jgi:hypothetical protein
VRISLAGVAACLDRKHITYSNFKITGLGQMETFVLVLGFEFRALSLLGR